MLAALSSGEAMTASEVATKTGLAAPTVSTTLSRLAKAGEITKADRRLPNPTRPPLAPRPRTPAPSYGSKPLSQTEPDHAGTHVVRRYSSWRPKEPLLAGQRR